jgi:hypothetical protein
MSVKIIAAAGLLCILASSAPATPTVSVTNGGLNASGNWIWNVAISNTDPVPDPAGTVLAAELGFRETTSKLVSVANSSAGANDNFDTVIPGNAIYGWEIPGVDTNGLPAGIETNCASGCTVNVSGTSSNSVFSALRSMPFTTVGPHNYIQIITKGPTAIGSASNLALRTSSISMSGAYSGNGRVAESTATSVVNYDTFMGTFSRAATAGDTNLVGGVDLNDFNKVVSNLGMPGTWSDGNFHGNGTGVTDLDDFKTVLINLGAPSGDAGAGLGGGEVPEPTTITIVLSGLIGLLVIRPRQ